MASIKASGEIILYKRDKRYGFIQNEKQLRILFPLKNIEPDPATLSRAWAFMEPGGFRIPVKFVSVLSPETGKAAADDVAPAFGFENLAMPDDLCEVMTVQSLDSKGQHGWAIRPDGDEVLMRFDDVVPQYRERWSLLYPGALIWARVGLRTSKEGKKSPAALDIELYSHEELRKIEAGEPLLDPDCETEVSNSVLPYESELLHPTNRKKTLYELIQERRALCHETVS